MKQAAVWRKIKPMFPLKQQDLEGAIGAGYKVGHLLKTKVYKKGGKPPLTLATNFL